MKTFNLTVEQIRNIFIGGSEFEKENNELNEGERDEIDAPDYGELLVQMGVIKSEKELE